MHCSNFSSTVFQTSQLTVPQQYNYSGGNQLSSFPTGTLYSTRQKLCRPPPRTRRHKGGTCCRRTRWPRTCRASLWHRQRLNSPSASAGNLAQVGRHLLAQRRHWGVLVLRQKLKISWTTSTFALPASSRQEQKKTFRSWSFCLS